MKTNAERLNRLMQKMRDDGDWAELYTAVAMFLHAEVVDGMCDGRGVVKAHKRIIKRFTTSEQWKEIEHVYE